MPTTRKTRQLPNALPWSRLQPLLIDDGAGELLDLAQAHAESWQRPVAQIDECRRRLTAPPEELNPPPLLTGADLIARRVPRGEIYRRLLEQIRAEQLDGQLATKDDALRRVDEIVAESSP